MGAMREAATFACALALAGCRFNFASADRDSGGSDVLGGDGGDAPGDGVTLPDGRPASTCAQLSVGMCDGFEGTVLDARWTSQNNTGSMSSIDTTRAYRGNSSLHSHTAAVGAGTESYATIRTYQGTNGMITGIAHVRAWAYFASPYPSSFEQWFNFATNTGNGISMGSLNGFIRSNDYTYSQSTVSATVTLPLDTWVCLEFEIPSNTEGTTRVYVNGVEATDAALATPVGSPQPPPDHVYLGLDWYQPPAAIPATDAWFDEVIIDSQPIGCAK